MQNRSSPLMGVDPAVGGALLGALRGFDALAARWVAASPSALQDGPPGPFRDDYHPKTLLRLAEVPR